VAGKTPNLSNNLDSSFQMLLSKQRLAHNRAWYWGNSKRLCQNFPRRNKM